MGGTVPMSTAKHGLQATQKGSDRLEDEKRHSAPQLLWSRSLCVKEAGYLEVLHASIGNPPGCTEEYSAIATL